MIETVGPVASAASSPVFEVVKTWITYAGVLVVAIVTAYAGIRKALKDLKTGEVVGAPRDKVAAAVLVETMTMAQWSDSNRAVGEVLELLIPKLDSMIHALNYNTEASRDHCKEIVELRHHIERLRDKMP